ncbi:hypothetical protein ABZS66_38145 [Dactylosporangium sp. NPDC005572]|uniref:hypothetical protein n=1 Tax=Dactylosporangium sp. NPDC005572 TaxID=3156889 RepID=UPI0033A0DA24
MLLHNGVPGRVELTGMVDPATRSIAAAVLRPPTKSVDASLLLATHPSSHGTSQPHETVG